SEDYFEGEGYQWFLMDGKLRLHITRRFTDISLRIETAKPLSMNEWQHVAVTYDGYRKGSGVKMYVNGTPRELTILFDELTYPFGPKEPFRVGKGAGDKYLFRGLIDDVRVFKTALTADQASTLPVLESVDTLAAIPEKSRTAAQAATLRLCFLSQYAAPEIRESLATLEKVRKERTKYSESIPTVMVMKESGKPRETFVLKRGAYDQPSERVYADTPAFLPAMRREYSKNRLGLAKWLVDSSNPLPARVTVNRFWQMLFGTGLVKSVEDFGAQGEWPEQQDLLDWLAVEFVESGWNVKHMLKTIVMSGVYRQSSRVSPELLQRDPENRLFARGPRQRLSHEMLRDQALAVSGLLVEKTGGPSVKPYQPPGLWQELSGGRYVQDKGEGLYRRSLYTFWKRTVAPPSMILFDSPTRENCIVRESRTNTPLQALNLMNDVTYLEASRRMAERLMKEGGEQPAQRLKFGFRLVTSRLPEPREFDVVARAFDGFRAKYSKDTAAAEKVLSQGDWARDKSLDAAELAAYAAVCSLLLNLDETVTKQ
ncbi:MAG: DUF1553 domain-containing protein, partial [Candidatus Solibacter usitatus]|nr:DUF1553 domain-containing protein [Candidatus Solibacter usitatus]